MVDRLPSPRSPPVLLLPLFLSSLVLFFPLSSAEDATNITALPPTLNSNLTTPLASNSSPKAQVPNPTVSLSLSLGVSQELNPNPFVNPNPVLSLSLSLSVSEELKANPFDLTLFPFPLLDEGAEPRQVKHRERRVEAKQHLKEDVSKAKSGSFIRGKCPYTVRIKTSCSSPPVTRDAVSLDFGDADHNEVYAARLDDPASGTFERCSVDTFRVVGPCGGRPCFLYLRRSGRDGWIPEYARIFYQPGDTHTAVTFAYEASLPDGVWYGFNLCHDGAGAALHSDTAVRPSRAKVDDNGGRDEDDKGDKGDPTIKMKTKVSGSVQTVFIKM